MPLAYLYSRYPVVSQTFCDSEMLALEGMGRELVIASLNPPPTSFRHERLRHLRADVVYPPPSAALKAVTLPEGLRSLVADHDRRYGERFKSATRARNAAWLAPVLARRGVRHLHVHFANRATHTALFLKRSGFTFSFTAHAQDYMVDLGSDELLRELAREASFVVAVSDFSRDDLRRRCPESSEKIHRVYNGLRPDEFPTASPATSGPLRLVSVGRLIEFKGFHHLIEAVARLRDAGVAAELEIIGDGPWRSALTALIDERKLNDRVRLAGVLSQDQIKDRLARAHVFALACCTAENGATDILPTVIMEAMAARLPVVSTHLAGVPEMVIPSVTGLLVPPADPAALAQALASLAADPALRERLGAAGRAHCEAAFSLDQTAAELARLFEMVPPAPAQEPPVPGNPPAHGTPPATRSLVLSARGDEPEWSDLDWLGPAADVRVLAAGTGGGPPGEALDFLPDAIVLEAAWRADPQAVTSCEVAYGSLDGDWGESFFRDARRAVHTAELVRKRGVTHVHAARSETVLWAWLVRRLTGVRTTAVIEAAAPLPRSWLAPVLADFDVVTAADEKWRAAVPTARPDVLGLAPPPKPGWFGPAKPALPDLTAFHRLLFP